MRCTWGAQKPKYRILFSTSNGISKYLWNEVSYDHICHACKCQSISNVSTIFYKLKYIFLEKKIELWWSCSLYHACTLGTNKSLKLSMNYIKNNNSKLNVNYKKLLNWNENNRLLIIR